MNDNHKTDHDVVYKYGVSEEQVMVRRVDADSAYFKRNLPTLIGTVDIEFDIVIVNGTEHDPEYGRSCQKAWVNPLYSDPREYDRMLGEF